MILNIPLRQKPTEFEVKIVKMFAFLPVRIDKDRIIWLTPYFIKYRYENGTHWLRKMNGCDYLVQISYFLGGARWVKVCAFLFNDDVPNDELDNYGLTPEQKEENILKQFKIMYS